MSVNQRSEPVSCIGVVIKECCNTLQLLGIGPEQLGSSSQSYSQNLKDEVEDYLHMPPKFVNIITFWQVSRFTVLKKC